MAALNICFLALGIVIMDPIFIPSHDPRQKCFVFMALKQGFRHETSFFEVSRLQLVGDSITLLLNVLGSAQTFQTSSVKISVIKL